MRQAVFTIILLALGCFVARPSMAENQVYSGYDAYFNGPNTGTGANQCNGSHCCPGGRSAMIGLHLDNNDFQCIDLPSLQLSSPLFIETNNQSNDMLTCPSGSYMVGAHGQNELICSRNPAINLGANVVHATGSNVGYDGGKQMHSCSEVAGQHLMLLTGIQESKNLLNCAPVEGWIVPHGVDQH
jgi:hypothetical protein